MQILVPLIPIETERFVNRQTNKGKLFDEEYYQTPSKNRKPVSYYRGTGELNPPSLKHWRVAQGFPRKHRNNATEIVPVVS